MWTLICCNLKCLSNTRQRVQLFVVKNQCNDFLFHIKTLICDQSSFRNSRSAPGFISAGNTSHITNKKTLFCSQKLTLTRAHLVVSDSLLAALLTAAEGKTGAVTSFGFRATTMSFYSRQNFFSEALGRFFLSPPRSQGQLAYMRSLRFCTKTVGATRRPPPGRADALLRIMLSKAPHLWHFPSVILTKKKCSFSWSSLHTVITIINMPLLVIWVWSPWQLIHLSLLKEAALQTPEQLHSNLWGGRGGARIKEGMYEGGRMCDRLEKRERKVKKKKKRGNEGIKTIPNWKKG